MPGPTRTPPGLTIRPAVADDLPTAARVFALADQSPEEESLALADLTLLHADDPRQVLVAERAGQVVGMAAVALRERHWHLVYLFVLPEDQGGGIGGALLTAALAVGRAAGCTIFTTESSGDARAMTTYLRAGMLPAPPLVELAAPEPRFPAPNWQDGLEARPLAADDDALLATATDIDRLVRGAPRERDLRRWLAAGDVGVVLFRRDTGVPVGYAMARPRGEHDHAWLGPVAALDPDHAEAVLERGLALAGTLHRPGLAWRAVVPGQNHVALRALLAAGFRATRFGRFLWSAPLGAWDRYLPHDWDLL